MYPTRKFYREDPDESRCTCDTLDDAIDDGCPLHGDLGELAAQHADRYEDWDT